MAEDTKTYDWECVRAWSEEIFIRISKGKNAWSDSYIIDRLQTQFSHERTQSAKAAVKGNVTDKVGYKMSETMRAARPGLPCKPYQSGGCQHDSDHINNGYRHLHVCSYCLTSKCELHPHPLKFCWTKKFNEQRGGGGGVGVGEQGQIEAHVNDSTALA